MILIDSYSESNVNTHNRIPTDYLYISQSFATGSFSGTINSVKWYLLKNGSSASGFATASIYATSSSKPTGSPLAVSDNFDISTLSTSVSSLSTFTFSGANIITLNSSTTYAVVITGTLSNFGIYVWFNTTGNYGTYSSSSDGSSWTASANFTNAFYVYGTSATTNGNMFLLF